MIAVGLQLAPVLVVIAACWSAIQLSASRRAPILLTPLAPKP